LKWQFLIWIDETLVDFQAHNLVWN
jgi:hypothetical protein